MTNRVTQPGRRPVIAGLAVCWLLPFSAHATPASGFSSQTFRGRIADNVGAHRWNPNPLFSFLIQSSNDQWGYDVVQGTTEFAPMDAMGRPSQSGWHDHPTALSIGLVVQGTVWSHQHPNLSCLRAIPTGSVFFERSGEIHNNYNLDPRTPAVVRIIHFVERNQTATRRDQPDQVTGNPTVAAPPPAPCPPDTPASDSHARHPAGDQTFDGRSTGPPTHELAAIAGSRRTWGARPRAGRR